MYDLHGHSGSPIATERHPQGGSMGGGFLHSAHDFVLQNPIMIEQTVYQNHPRDFFESSIAKLSAYTIRGAEYNSFARDPPPRCHPQTRLNILQRINNWFHNPEQGKRILWLYGPAGVGKSAIIQTLAESLAEGHQQNLQLGATVFFSRPNHRDKPLLVFTTIAHQLAIQYLPYREFIQNEFANDPTLAEKSMTETFKRFLVKPFGQQHLCRATGPLVISLDGLDECEGERRQGEIISLISGFVTQFPSVPLLWIISSRPEPHLSVVFSRDLVQRACWKEEIPVDSDDACQDVELYLRNTFEEIRQNYPSSFPPASRWPNEHQFLKVSTASAGLFAFAATITRFLDDPEYGNPVAQLNKVLAIIEEVKQLVGNGQSVNPFSTLDALYTRILSSIPSDVLATIARIFGQIYFPHPSFISLSNFLGLAQHDAYGALQRLHSVIRVPPPELADTERIGVYHASFTDFLYSETRSGPFRLLRGAAWDDHLECNKRILCEALDVASSKADITKVVLSWPTQDVQKRQMHLYQKAVTWLSSDYTKASESARQQHLTGVLQILAGLDPGDLPLPEVDFTRLLLEVQQSPLFEELVAHNIMQLVPISHLDLSQLKKEEFAHAYCEQIGDAPVLDSRGFEFVHNYSYHVCEDGEFENAKMHTFHHAMGSLSSENMDQVLSDLDYVRSNLPSTMVTIFGVNPKKTVMFERELIPGVQLWHYTVPYGPL